MNFVTIRPEQMEAFNRQSLDEFLGRAATHLRKEFPKETAKETDEMLRSRVRRGIKRAAEHNLTSEFEVMCFTDASLLLGEAFEHDPNHVWANDLLEDEDVDPVGKADRLLAEAMKRREPEHRNG